MSRGFENESLTASFILPLSDTKMSLHADRDAGWKLRGRADKARCFTGLNKQVTWSHVVISTSPPDG